MAPDPVSLCTILNTNESISVTFISDIVAVFESISVQYTQQIPSLTATQFTVKGLILSDSQ